MAIEIYQSNDWLIPVGERTKAIISNYSKEKRLEIATLVVAKEMIGQPDIPWVFIFDNDDLDETLDRLLQTLRATDGDRVVNDVDLELGVDDLRRIISEAGADTGILASHAAQHMLKVAHGDPHVEFNVYQDLARKYPQYAEDWLQKLKEQFGDGFMDKMTRSHLEFFVLLGNNILLAHHRGPRSMQHSGEDTSDYLRRAFGTASEVGFEKMSQILGKRLLPYREAAYQLRDLEFSGEGHE